MLERSSVALRELERLEVCFVNGGATEEEEGCRTVVRECERRGCQLVIQDGHSEGFLQRLGA